MAKGTRVTQSRRTRILFPIGGKLVTIITMLLLLSLSAITMLVSALMSADVRDTAETNNQAINQRSATEAETTLRTVRSDTLTLLRILSAMKAIPPKSNDNDMLSYMADFADEPASAPAPDDRPVQEEARFFFEQNPHIAAIMVPDNWELLNDNFFLDYEIEPALLAPFFEQARDSIRRASVGAEILLNGAPTFGIPMLVFLCPWERGNALMVFFSAEHITEDFGTGANASFMINDVGEVLVHADQELVKAGANLSGESFIQTAIRSTERQLQTLYTDEEGVRYFGAFQKLTIANTIVVTRIQSDVVFEGIVATTRRNIYLTVSVLFLALLFIWFFSKSISEPLKTLKTAAEQIEEGNYKLELRSKSQDETGVLTASFISMSHALANFEKFTNKAIVQVARQGKLTLGGVNKNATVAFIFIRDFSELAEGMNASEVVELINEFMLRMVPCITNTGGAVDKFLTQGGVIIMALWGTIESAGNPEGDALNCIRAVLMMRAALRSLNDERQGKVWEKAPRIKMGCGINVGELVAGQMGSEDRMEYTVIGDTVNLAARFEGPNDLFDTDILITENVDHLIGRTLLIEEMPSIEVKGKEAPLRVFAVVNMVDEEQTARILKDLERIPKTVRGLDELCVGPRGPHSMKEVRERW